MSGAHRRVARAGWVYRSRPSRLSAKHTRGIPPEDAQIVAFTQLLQKQGGATIKALQERFGNED